MKCHELRTYQDDYLDNLLPEDLHDTVTNHLHTCPECFEIMRQNKAMLKDLKTLETPSLSPDFLNLAIKNAARRNRMQQQKKWWLQFGAAAAVLCLVILGSINYSLWSPVTTPQPTGITLSLHESKEVILLVQSEKALEKATITIELPDQLMLANNTEIRHFSWIADFKEGKNLIPLPLVATGDGRVQIIATIEHQSQVKTMHMAVQITIPKV